MNVAVTGATGFIGRYLVRQLVAAGHRCRCWFRPDGNRSGSDHSESDKSESDKSESDKSESDKSESDRGGFDDVAGQIDWVPGGLGEARSAERLVEGSQAVVHAALYHPGGGFRGGEGNLVEFVEKNVLGSIELIEAARAAGAKRFVYISTCAVHERILPDRPLDETHPTTPTSHYGAHKAAVEQFVRSYGWGQGYEICALRPTGVYGAAHPIEHSKWFDLVREVVRGRDVTCERGGKEVHAADVARGATLLLTAPGVAGELYNCYDRYISQFEVASLAQKLSGSRGRIMGKQTAPKNEIVTANLRALGMEFGGQSILEQTIGQLVNAAKSLA